MNSETVDDVLALVAQLLVVKSAADGKVALMSQQGQGMDGYSELANYRQIIDKLDAVLWRVSSVHRWKPRT